MNGEVVGYIHGCDYDCVYSDSLKDILGIAVDPAYQGRGIGRLLLSALEDWARQDGCAGVRLVSGFERHGAHQFYMRCGYTHRKDQKNFVKLF
jgi:GNAT superfamily N-acetyltransferase